MKKMKYVPFKETITTFIVVAVVVLLIGTLVFPSLTVLADDEEDEVGVPQWKEGERWRYKDVMPMPEVDIDTIIEMEVTDENFEVNAYGEDGQKETYETYEVRRIENPDDSENRWEGDFYYWKENLAQIYNRPVREAEPDTAYHPPLIELDFPLYEGKEWSSSPWVTDYEYDKAHSFTPPGDVEKDEYPEANREYAFFGRVENRTTKEIALGEFDTWMVNLTVAVYDEDQEQAQIHRYEMYYSPEVKNLVYTDIYEVQALPEEETVGDGDEYMEDSVGNETLIEYDADPYEPPGEEESFFGIGVVLVIIGVGTASFYIYKKVKSSI